MPARVSSPRFVGRADELSALDSALARAADGHSGAVLVGGDAGMGKSRLVAEFERRGRAAGALVLVGECVELAEGELPYGPIVAALRPLVATAEAPLEALHPAARAPLSRLWPELAPPDRGTAVEFVQGQLFEAVHRLLAAQAAERPLAVVIEDLHWADRSTRDLLTFLIRNSRGERLLFVTTYRTDEVQRRHPLYPFVSELERSGRADRVTLPPFDEQELREQLHGILGEEPEPQLARRLLERSEGNPFLTEELLAAADQGVLPDSLRDVLLVRVERMSDAARRTLQLAAAVARPVSHELLAAATELEPAELRDALREAAEHRVLVPAEDGSAYAFRHALLREAVYADLLPGERATLHRALAEALEADRSLSERGRAAAELAHHWYVAGRAEPALMASLEAAEQAERVRASAEAARHLERSLELLDRIPADEVPEGVDAAAIARRAADAAILSGSNRRAIDIARQLVDETDGAADPTAAGLAHARLARFLWIDGKGDAAIEHYDMAVELVPSEPSAERAEVLAASAHARSLATRMPEARALGSEALEIARAVGARLVEASALNTLGPMHKYEDPEDPPAQHRTARAIAEEFGAAEEIGRSYVNEAQLLEDLGRLPEAVAVSREGVARARELGAERGWGDYLASDLAERLITLGEWDEAARTARAVLDVDSAALNVASAHQALGRIAAERGDFDEARERVRLEEEISGRSGGAMWAGPRHRILASCSIWAGELDAARAIVAAASNEIGSEVGSYTAPVWTLGIRAEADRAERARALGHGEEAESCAAIGGELLERFERVAEEDNSEPVRREKAVATAELRRLLGQHDAELWLSLANQFGEASQPYPKAYMDWRAAEALVTSGGAAGDAERLLRSAAETAVRLGARPLLGEVSGLARRARLSLDGVATAEPRSVTDELGLTERELEVLLLLAEGRTNRQIGKTLFMSEKTASVHVSRILAKLGAANRAEAAGLAHKLGVRPN